MRGLVVWDLIGWGFDMGVGFACLGFAVGVACCWVGLDWVCSFIYMLGGVWLYLC